MLCCQWLVILISRGYFNTTHRAINDLPPLPANGRSNKILLRLPKKEKPREPPAEAPVGQAEVPASPAEPDELTPKAWNLRPRKPKTKKSSTRQWIMEMEFRSGPAGEEARRVKVSVPLAKEEVEADYLAMAGGRPARRPKKRPRKVQRAVDNCFPGLRLANITPDLYKVADDHPKVPT